MAELITITLPDGKTEVINLDYVMKIEPVDRDQSSITMTDGLKRDVMLAKGSPGQIATAPRQHG
jgi:hypothetical protein